MQKTFLPCTICVRYAYLYTQYVQACAFQRQKGMFRNQSTAETTPCENYVYMFMEFTQPDKFAGVV